MLALRFTAFEIADPGLAGRANKINGLELIS
jgi:hypothetical protein